MSQRKRWTGVLICLFLVVLFTGTLVHVYAAEPDQALSEEAFSCYTFDTQGQKLDGYWAENDETWYLFVTSTQEISDTDLYYTGSIADASSGQLDTESSVVTDPFLASGDSVELIAEDGAVYSVVVMQSSLPSVYITLNGTTLDEIHADKDVKHAGNSISIMDPGDTYNLTVDGTVEVKGRGNSTWTYFEKKGYQIKFDKKTSVLGMGQAKKWVLLANAADETLLHNTLAFDLAARLDMTFVTEFQYIDLWIDGEYRGNYILGEKVELGSTRLNLEDPQATLFEHDFSFYYDEDYWFFNDRMGKYFTVKETNIDDSNAEAVQAAIDAFQDSVDELMSYLYSTPAKEVTLSKLETMIDVDSFAKYYLINEYCGNWESVASSFYWYQDGLDDVLHLGPVWDFDCSMGNDVTAADYYLNSHVLFNSLMACPEFYDRTVSLYNQYRTTFAGISSCAAAFEAQIAESAAMNFTRWDVWGQPNPKDSLNDYSASYEEGFGKLMNWLSARARSFAPQQGKTAYVRVDENFTTMDIFYEGSEDDSLVTFAVWSDVNGQDDLTWYPAEKNADGVWEAQVDLSAHQSLGKYTIHVGSFFDGVRYHVATGYAYIEKINAPEITAALSQDRQSLEIAVSNVGNYKNVSIDVWCETDGQNDLATYTPTTYSGNVRSCTVSLANHRENGVYQIQVKGTKGQDSVLIGETSVTVRNGVWPLAAAEISTDCKTMTLTLSGVDSYTNVSFQVWGEENGKNDAAWYTAAKQDDGNWKSTVNLVDHGELGTYQIDAYGTKEGARKQLAHLEVYVEKIAFPVETTPIYRLYNPYTQEHIYTANEAEREQLEAIGWLFDGVAWNAPKSGDTVYRLYNPFDDWHTYSGSQEEIGILTELGWVVDGVVCCSASGDNTAAVYRLFNPYEQRNYHLLTVSEEERDWLVTLGWQLEGVAMYAAVS